jgi:hypothetical protein
MVDAAVEVVLADSLFDIPAGPARKMTEEMLKRAFAVYRKKREADRL